MKFNKTLYHSKYGLGFNSVNNLYLKYGFRTNKHYYNMKEDTILIKEINKIFTKVLIKDEILIKDKFTSLETLIKNGSYKGYKRFRGLPMYNQRTKTNSRTPRKKLL